MRESLSAAITVASSAVAYVEARAALARRHHRGALTVSEYHRSLQDFENDWERYVRVEATEDLLRNAARLAETRRLRAYNAVHLASALAYRARRGSAVTFASWDEELGFAAKREGFLLLPTRRG